MHRKGVGLPKGCDAPPYLPAGIPLQQIAGSVVLERKYFGLHAYDITIGGDSIVPASSADGYIGSATGSGPKGSFAPNQMECRIAESSLLSIATQRVAVPWQLFTDSALMDQLMSDKAGTFVAVVLGRILMVNDSCAHAAMMTNSAVVDQVKRSLRALVAKHAPMTMEALKAVRVPSLCDHAPGKLKGGILKGNGHNGDVQLDQDLSTLGLAIPGRPDGAAAVFHCSQGGIGWPDYVLFYDNSGNLLGTFDTGTVGANVGRQLVSKVAIDHSTVRVDVVAVPLKGDNELWGSSRAVATYVWDPAKSKMTRDKLDIAYPDPTARAFADALQRRDSATAANLSPSSSVPELTLGAGTRAKFDHCIGPFSDEFGGELQLVQRGCLINYYYDDGNYSVYMAVMELQGASWRIVQYRNVAG